MIANLSVQSHAAEIDGENENDENGDPDSGVHAVVPKVDETRGSSDLSGCGDGHAIPWARSVASYHGFMGDVERMVALQKFQPVAAPQAGSIILAACRVKPPVTGMNEDISPEVYETAAVTRPMTMKPRSAPTGPALEMALPDPRKRPVPYSPARLVKIVGHWNMRWGCEERGGQGTCNHASNGNHLNVPLLEVRLDAILHVDGPLVRDIALVDALFLGPLLHGG